MLKLNILFFIIILSTKIINAQTVVDIQVPVKMDNDVGSSSINPAAYSWGQESNNLQGVNIYLPPASTPYKTTIDFQQNNGRIAVNTLGSGTLFVDLQFKYDNDPYVTIYNGNSKESHGWVQPPTSFRSLGNHTLKVKYLTHAGVTFEREYNFRMVPDASKFFADNVTSDNRFRNKIRLWEAPNSQNHIPLLLVEGFDATNTRSAEFYRQVANVLINNLIANGYKVYILNFAFNAQDMRNNAAVVHSAVQYISQINGNADIVLAGASMGGVICRYALAKDETNRRAIQSTNFLPVSDYLSFDSPHQGAVISPTLINFTLNQDPTNYTMNKPAFRQLVRNNPESSYLLEHQNFYAELNGFFNNGYPTHCRNIGYAFSNSSIPNPHQGQSWLSIVASIGPGNVLTHTDFVTGEMALSGSFLPIETGLMNDVRQAWGLINVTTTKTPNNPTFITNFSALDRHNGISRFCIAVETPGVAQHFHDIFPFELVSHVVQILKSPPILNIAQNASYNFTEQTSNIIRSDANVYGSLYLMKNGPSGFSSAPGPNPNANSSTMVTTYSCEPVNLTCHSGGLIEIGDVSIGNSGSLVLAANSTLHLKGSSHLKVSNNSQLVIEEGATLLIEPGAIIELIGSNAVLEIKGTLRLMDNAFLTVNGGGIIKWSKTNGNPVVISGVNSTFYLNGPNRQTKIMEVGNDVSLTFPASLDVEFRNGKFDCAKGSAIHFAGKTTIFNSWFEGAGPGVNRFNGVTVNSTKVNSIGFTYFDNAVTGLNLIQVANINTPNLIGNRFRWCGIGLKVHDKGALISMNHFISNGTGLFLSANSSRVQVNSSIFQENLYGVNITGTNPAPIQISNSSFNWSSPHGDEIGINSQFANLELKSNTFTGYRYAVELNSGYLRATCNNISGAEIGIEAWENSTVNIANDARNIISTNGTGIGLYRAWLKLENGKNKLDNNTDRSISGTLREDLYFNEHLTHKTGRFDYYKYKFSNNLLNSPIMFPATTTGTNDGFLINNFPDVTTCYQEYLRDPLNPNSAIITLVDYSRYNEPLFFECSPCNFNFLTCGEASPPWYTQLYEELGSDTDPTQIFINTPRFQQVELKDAIRQALSNVTVNLEDVQNDLLALVQLKDLLTYNYGANKSSVKTLMSYVRHSLSIALANAYLNGLLPVQYGLYTEQLSEYASALLAELNAQIDENPNDTELIGYLTIEKAQVYRLAGHFAQAIDELNTPNADFAQNRDYWLCILQNELELVSNVKSVDEFVMATTQCGELFQARRQRMRSTPRIGNYTTPTVPSLSLYPNPSSGTVTVNLPGISRVSVLEVYSMQGVLLEKMEVPAYSTTLTVRDLELANGTYLMKYTQDEGVTLYGRLLIVN